MTRARRAPIETNRIENQRFDLIVVGAGLNGAGIARDAAMRGMKVLLLDKGDFSSGTTAWSTRLIHGGLRYLEYYEVPLVRESLRERERLLHIAPHLVEPLQFMIPIYEGNKRGPGLIRLGMIAYDLLSFDRSVPGHRMIDRQAALDLEPGLNPDGLRAAALYYDAQITFPERLTVENALSARDHGATVITYARADDLILDGQNIVGVRCTDLLGGVQFSVHAPLTVNVAGPWVDQVLGSDGNDTERMIGGTKGSHLIVREFSGAPKEAMYIEAEDGRPYFIIPWNNLYLIGTTDLRYRGDLDRVVPSDDEIDYLISATNRVIPSADLTRGDVLYVYAGVRPLPYEPEGAEGSITRSHIVHDHAPEREGLISIVGGKLTTYRNLAEQTVDLALKKLGRPPTRCRTASIPLAGGNTGDWERFTANFRATSGLPDPLTERLLRVYGTLAQEVLRIARENPTLMETFSPSTGAIGAEVAFALRWEMAETLGDILLRRTMVGLGPDVGLDAYEAAAEIAQRHAGWDEERVASEIADYRRDVQRFRPRALAAMDAND